MTGVWTAGITERKWKLELTEKHNPEWNDKGADGGKDRDKSGDNVEYIPTDKLEKPVIKKGGNDNNRPKLTSQPIYNEQ